MPSFTFTIARTHTITEGFERSYTADTLEQAQALADHDALAADRDCPDDNSEIESGFTETSEFAAELK